MVSEWCAKSENADSFPPIVFNITDGEASDSDYEMLRGAASRLRKVATNDGNTLLVNVHISSNTNHTSIIFPNLREVPLAVRYAHLLSDMSSVLPPQFHNYVTMCRKGHSSPPYIAMSYNASMSELISMLNIGSRTITVE